MIDKGKVNYFLEFFHNKAIRSPKKCIKFKKLEHNLDKTIINYYYHTYTHTHTHTHTHIRTHTHTWLKKNIILTGQNVFFEYLF